MKSHRAVVVWGLLACSAWLAGASRAAAVEPPPTATTDPSPVLPFRRVYLPEDRLDQWPRGDVRYLPLDGAEFERMLGQLQHSSEAAAPPAAETARAMYSARLSGSSLIDGEATLEIRSFGPGPTLLRLDPCRLAIQAPHWSPSGSQHSDAAHPDVNGSVSPASSVKSPAGPATAKAPAATPVAAPGKPLEVARTDDDSHIGTLGVGGDGVLSLRVAGSGSLHFGWTLRGQQETAGTLAFTLQLPPSSSIQIRLQLPSGLIPTVDHGFVTLLPTPPVPAAAGPSAAPPAKTGSTAPAASSASADAAGMQTWQIDLGGQNQVVLHLSPRDLLHEHRPLTLVRQSLIYDISPHGLQLSAELKLDVLGEPLRQLTLLLDRPLDLVTARSGDVQIPWAEIDASHADPNAKAPPASQRAESRQIVLDFPEPLQGRGRVVRLGAVAPLPKRGRLPTVRPAPDGAFWQEGSASLLVALPLELNELRLQGARQTKVEPLAAPLAGEAITLQYFRPDADVNVAIVPQPDQLQFTSGTTIEVRGGTMTGHYVADVSATEGECFDLEADIAPSWIIDSVDSVPSGAVGGWNREGSADAAGRLHISLSKSIRPERPLRLIVAGRWRRAPLGERLRIDDLKMVSLRHLKDIRSLAAIRLATTFRCQLTGADGLHRLDLNHLDPADASLIGDGSSGIGLVLDDFAADLAVVLGSEAPRFSGDVHLDVKVLDRSLTESYTFHCTPESAEVDRLLIHFSRAKPEPLHWRLVPRAATGPVGRQRPLATSEPISAKKPGAEPAPPSGGSSGVPTAAEPDTTEAVEPLSARRLSAAEQTSMGLTAGGEVWELALRQPQGVPLTVAAVRTTRLDAETPVSLGWLVQAASQQGSVAVHSVAELFPEITNRRLKPIPAEPPPLDAWPNILAAYQYEPQDEVVSAASDPAPSLSIAPGKQPPAAWAWSCRLDSHYSSAGAAEHLVSLRIENTGRSRLNFQLPAGGVLDAAWIDDLPASVANSATQEPKAPDETAADKSALLGPTMQLELPLGRRFVMVALHWTSAESPLSIVSSRAAALPSFDLPILARQWYVWLPPRYRLSGATPADESAIGRVSGSQRLFGPLGRPTGEAAFDPSKSASWLSLVRRISGHDSAWSQARQLLDRLASRAGPNETAAKEATAVGSATGEPAATTWGELLAQTQSELAHEVADGSAAPLLIDATALASVGLSPRSLVRIPLLGEANPEGWPLVQSDLVLLVHPRAILLTTRSAATASAEPWSAAGSGLLRRIAPGGLAEELAAAAAAGGSQRFPTVEAWSVGEIKSPWPAAGEHATIDQAGWVVYHFELPDAPLPRIWVARADALLALGCGLFLFVAMLVWWKGDVSWRLMGITMTIATAAALLVPAVYTPLGAGLWLGLACGWWLRRLTRLDRPARAAENAPSLKAVGVAGSALLLCLLAAPHAARAAEPAPSVPVIETSPSTTAAIPEVLIPKDDPQHPGGKVYLVPESLYNELVRRAPRLSLTASQWLITAATYRGGLVHASTPGTIDTIDWSASYELDVFAPAAHVRIPFGGLGTNLLPDGVRLDGQPIRFHWAGSRELVFDVADAGHHELKLAFRPTPTVTAAATTVDFAVLPVATARLELTVPSGLEVEVPSAQAALALDRQSGRLTGLLGPTDRVAVHATETSGHGATAAVADLDELFWLRVRPGSVVLETHFNFRVVDGTLSRIRLRADPHLRRLPSTDTSLAEVRTEQGDPQTIYVGLAQPATEQVSLKLSFLLTDTSGIGNLRLPRLEAVGMRSVTRRLAVSVESPLEYDEPTAGLWQPFSVDQFLTAWGGADVPPQLVYQLPIGADNWNLAIHSRQPQLASNDQLVATISHGRLSVAWLADLSIRGGSVFQVHLPLAPPFVVENAQLRQGAAEDRPIRWARTDDGVTLFLPGPAADHSKLLLQGWMPQASGTAQLPRLRIDGGRVESQTIMILRGAEVKVTLSNSAGLKQAATVDRQSAVDRARKDGLLESGTLERDRLALCLVGKPAADTMPALRIERNAPHVTAIEKTTVERSDDAWTATVDLDLDVAGGVVDALRFELPAHWNGLTKIVPDMPLEIVDIPGENRRQMILRPAEPITGAWRMSLKGMIAAAGQRVRVPDIRPLGLGTVRRFVLLPTHSNEQQLVWETRGLNVEPLPAGFATGSPQLEVYRTCQVVGETFEATLKSVEKAIGQPHVRLADIAVSSPDGRNGYGTAAFDLEPAGSANCVLELAEHTRLIHIRVNGLPAAVRPVAQSPLILSVALGSGKLPQHIEVVFQCQLPLETPGATERRLPAPVLVRTPVEATLWTLAGPIGRESSAATNAATIAPLQQEMDRLQAAWQLLNSAAAVLAEESPETASAWYAPWARRLLVDRSAIQRQRGAESATDAGRSIDAEMRSIDEQGIRLAHRIGTSKLLSELSAARPAAEGVMQLWQASDPTNQAATGFYVHGFSPALGLVLPHSGPSSWSLRLATALAGTTIVGLFFWIGARPGIRVLTIRWPYWVGVVVGLAWWLALNPSLFGLAIVAVSVLGSFWPGYLSRQHTK